MKRHKYALNKHLKKWNIKRERANVVLKYLSKMKNLKCLSDSSKLLLQVTCLPVSKIANYCVVSGRVRYTIGINLNSRHMFYSRNSNALITGFFMSSW